MLPSGELALELLAFMRESYPEQLKEYLKSEYSGEDTPLQILEAEAGARGCIRSGGVIDYDRAAQFLLTDFRAGRMGRVTLELPEGADLAEPEVQG